MIYLMPYDQMIENNASLLDFDKENISTEDFIPHQDFLFFDEGKKAINYLMSEINLNRNDQVAILTTTDSSFVSSCVTCSIFNFAQVSRVITNKTKLIYVIHEFGFPYIQIEEISKYAKANKIPLVEDSAHSFDSYLNDQRLGSFGDYAIFSLAKILPIKNGGLLTGKKLNKENVFFNKKTDYLLRKKINEIIGYLPALTKQRIKNYRFFSDFFIDEKIIFNETKEKFSPFVFGFISDADFKIKLINVEIHPCYIEGGTFLPTNPFLTQQQREYIAKHIK